ncbi:TerC family protein [Anthocerotibacter panamensis]|uniref:TerC family protein n=1 Tax=Anthocerotibacter panamensis TaxID=2857077 RepID=UPI001C40728D|nr:TerC family protein [Anthocerotibacter panamensis]
MGTQSIWLWLGFNLFVLVMLALDLGVFHRKAHAISVKEALGWSAFWITLALTFNVGIYFWFGPQPALEFFTGYLIEKSLSVDNIFVIALIFSYFAVPTAYQHRVLFWGILGALVMRGALILVGAVLLKEFHWIIYIFGAFLVFTGLKMAFAKDEKLNPEDNPVVKLVRRLIPVTDAYDGQRFFLRVGGKLMATPLFLVLMLVETTDLIFAVDSIPAIFAVTQDPFIVYTSNVFAILGLRSLYFVLAGVMDKFHYLKLGLAVILSLVGVKMLLIDLFKIPTPVSLGVIAAVLAIAVLASLVHARRTTDHEPEVVLPTEIPRKPTSLGPSS